MKDGGDLILEFLKRVQKRQMFCIFLSKLWIFVVICSVQNLIIEFLSRKVPVYFKWHFQIGISIFLFLGYLIYIIKSKPSLEKTALLIDSFGFKEIITTSLELIDSCDEISKYVKSSAAHIIRNIDLRKVIKPQLDVRKWTAALFVVLSFTVILSIPNPKMKEAERLHVFNVEKKNEINKIEGVKKEVFKNLKLNGLEKRKIDEIIMKMKKEIKIAKSKGEMNLAKQKAWFLLENLKKENLKASVLVSAATRLQDYITKGKDAGKKRNEYVALQNSSAKNNSKDSNSSLLNGQDTTWKDSSNKKDSTGNSKTKARSTEETAESSASSSSFSQNQDSSTSSEQSSFKGQQDSNKSGANTEGQGSKESSSENSTSNGQSNNNLPEGSGSQIQTNNTVNMGSGLGAAIPPTSSLVSPPQIFTKNLHDIEASNQAVLNTGKESGKLVQKEGVGERGQKLNFNSVFSEYKKEANEYLETDEVPAWAKEITKRYFESLENSR
ncbi:conserved hypothetical protein [Caldicellulosiruptor hydrothermalis 108]|uniref:Uncharacterized protein n=1 Tax=Caldicellulosiruptor hydrothermalis (strain DSM 18901 / VKM B-2411 / 108) TaxID=632292 RepID=E4QCG2_CALH1|nr:hypothetical protein [Caldicellulosiruptor hydrothermalis]ADQ06258.1 conserved hypothetical protein [Caldicellulosiruptor hydrothermalis 108]